MSFIDRVKSELKKKNEEELANIEIRIKELEKTVSNAVEEVQKVKKESEEASKEKSKAEKNILSKKELENLEIIYNFISNYPEIEKITERILHTSNMARYIDSPYGYIESDQEAFDEEVKYREKLCVLVKKLNEEISKIINGEEVENSPEEKNNNVQIAEIKAKRGGIFSILSWIKTKILDSKDEKIEKKGKKLFDKYRRSMYDFKSYYSSFLFINFDGITLIDKNICTKVLMSINSLVQAKKRGAELSKEDEEYLKFMQPHDLWREIAKYYASTSVISNIMDRFEKNISKYEKLYKENPELFDIENLERIFEENHQKVVEVKIKKKDTISKNKEVAGKVQEEKEVRAKLKALEEKKKLIMEKTKKINNAKTLKEIGYKNKQDAVEKLSMDTKDYIVIPIPQTTRNISELFDEKKRLKIEVDGKVFFTEYSNDVATGKINSMDYDKSISGVLMIPISVLKKEDIDNIRTGKISLNKSVLEYENLLAIIPEGREFNFVDSKVEINKYSYGTILEHVKNMLQSDYVVDTDETENYDIFKGIPNVSMKEKKLKKEAVKICIAENVRRNVLSADIIYVNGKTFFINAEDEKEIIERGKKQPINERKLQQIANEIEMYLIEDGKNSVKIDLLYQELLMEYMRVNKKAKADYYEESDTIVTVNGKEISIKPILPAKDELITKRYSRTRENIVYKTMKLAALVNKFAHLTENVETQKSLYDAKLDLIESAIDLSKDNPNIKLRKRFDANKMALSVIAEIPGYNMIALHVMNKSDSLSYKAHSLEETDSGVLKSSVLLAPGVNKNLLMEIKNMSHEERLQFLGDMELTVFYKLALRMGYLSDNISSIDDRRKFIQEMVSDQKIDELLKEYEELER